MRRSGKHRIFGGHPSFSRAFEEIGDLAIYRGIADNARIADFDENRAFRIFRVSPVDGYRTHLVVRPTIGPDYFDVILQFPLPVPGTIHRYIHP
jgi:hypothetical protein